MRSRSAFEFRQRSGLTDEAPATKPRLAIDDLLVHLLPAEPAVDVLRRGEGAPSPDRAATLPWPGEVPTDP